MSIPKYLIYAIALLWLWSGLQPMLTAPEESLELLKQVGFQTAYQKPIFYLASLMDIALGILCFTRWQGYARFWMIQIILVMAYSMIIAFALPQMWLHPFSPLIKNLPILAILYFLYQQCSFHSSQRSA